MWRHVVFSKKTEISLEATVKDKDFPVLCMTLNPTIPSTLRIVGTDTRGYRAPYSMKVWPLQQPQ